MRFHAYRAACPGDSSNRGLGGVGFRHLNPSQPLSNNFFLLSFP